VHPALAAIVTEVEPGGRPGTPADPPVMPTALAETAADYLRVRSRLCEGSLLAPKGAVDRLVAILARGSAAPARSPVASARPPAA
jgi:hypothetical protein